ncbi:hypothetical protein NIM72_16980 [Pantoea sp. B550]|uniref:hypothetical protein n=1 Tax=Pantoea TaxID=53335 RepID=UPI000E7D999E|nr:MULTISPECIES: hypothetical protein [Pantoea]MCP1207204.1 hypothetical protein [Pantoea sp. B550]MCT2416436.1 hypothetical protein [Pantoea sp. XY16]QZX94852.1 hypothetical protein K6R05_13955 [Pantoea alfalfae]HBV90875.1 hypothetical protein [Pantoea sp.]
MKKSILACFISVFILTGCGPKELSPEEKQKVEQLKVELSQTESEISSANATNQNYSGGLIKTLISARVEILKTNQALIKQRIDAIESGAKITMDVHVIKPDEAAADSVKSEIDALNAQISQAKAEANQYSGGLVLAMKLAAIATQEQTMAMLQQRYLSARYGLANAMPSDLKQGNVAEAKPIEKAVQANNNQPLLPPGDGPFGLESGLTKKNIEDMTGEELKPYEGVTNLYTVKFPPKKNTEFEGYGLLISPKSGLCQIRALGKNIDTDSYGLALQSKYKELFDSLSSIYGKPKSTDFLLSGSIWKEPQDWMMALNKKERFLSAQWEESSATPLKNRLTSVSMEVRANDSSKGYVYLQYDFNNIDACNAEIEEAKKSSL